MFLFNKLKHAQFYKFLLGDYIMLKIQSGTELFKPKPRLDRFKNNSSVF